MAHSQCSSDWSSNSIGGNHFWHTMLMKVNTYKHRVRSAHDHSSDGWDVPENVYLCCAAVPWICYAAQVRQSVGAFENGLDQACCDAAMFLCHLGLQTPFRSHFGHRFCCPPYIAVFLPSHLDHQTHPFLCCALPFWGYWTRRCSAVLRTASCAK